MSDSKHKGFIADGLRALAELRKEKKAAATVERFATGERTKVRSTLTDVQKAANPYAEKRALMKKEIAEGKRKPFRIKGSAVAAFMFLPQFHLCFRGFSHIYPVFMRILAQVLVQASLLPENHPAINYGAEGVPNIKFSKMMGDVWFNLRTTRRTGMYQYGMFSVVVMMVVALTATIGTFFARIFLGVGEVAQAQLFFTHPANPYGGGAGQTNIGNVGNITGAGGLFDGRVTNNNISTDYGLMVLDKILRQAAADTPNGGALQNALAGMMGAYNTGVITIACVMMLWMIVSIVIDTAKTGVFGGGRHNMVWAPIRVMFALGLLFPLGSGFSSGQYAVMKLAEWGSNFGTRAWSQYVAGVVGDQSLLAPFAVNNATSLVNSISKVMVCQVAFNTYLQQTQGGLPPDQVIRRVQDATPNLATVTNRYTNNTGSNVCGTITYSTASTTDDMDRILASSAATPVTAMTGSTPIASATDYSPAPNFSLAARAFRNAMRGALEPAMQDSATSALGSGGTVIEMARRFACRYVARKFPDGGSGTSPVSAIPQCDAATTAAATVDPTIAEQQGMANQMQTDIMTAYEGPGKTALTTYIGGPMVTQMQQRGWAGMGMWYQDIANMNGLMAGAQQPTATVEPGSVWIGAGSSHWLRCIGSKIIGRSCRISGLEEKVLGALDGYDKWWANSTAPGTPGRTLNTAATGGREINTGTSGGLKSLMSAFKNLSGGDNGIAVTLARFFVPSYGGAFIFRAVDLAATGTYPLAQLANTGHSVLLTGGLLWGGVTLVQAVSTLKGFGFSLGIGVAVSSLINLFATIGSMLIISGIMISFYLPVLPFLRVAFAVLTWMVSVFEAVVMVPVAALAHLVSTGDGLTAGQPQLRTAWIMWLNVLMRPVLTVMGFVAGMLIYNAFAVYFHTTFSQGAASVISSQNYFMALIAKVCYSVIYLGTLYTAANTSFKLLDIFPENLIRWMGGSPDRSISSSLGQGHDGNMYAATNVIRSLQRDIPESQHIKPEIRGSAEDRAQLASRAENMKSSSENKVMTKGERDQAALDKSNTIGKMSIADRKKYESLTGKEKDDFLAKKFVQQENKGYIKMPWEKGLDGKRGFKDYS